MGIAGHENNPFKDVNANFRILVEDQSLPYDLAGLVRFIEYESTDNMADMAKITFSNPNFILSDFKGIQPGNEIFIYMGYGNDEELTPVGRVQVVRHHPTYPSDGIPTIEVIGYTADRRMMDHSPVAPKNTKKSKDQNAAIYTGQTYSQVIEDKCRLYEFEIDVDPTKETPKDFIQRVGMSDYEFIRGMANITGFYFWVDGDEVGNWTLHFKNPDNRPWQQEKTYTFRYNRGQESTLLEFRPQLLIQGQKTKIRAQYQNSDGDLLKVEFPDSTPTPGPDPLIDLLPTDVDRAIDRDLFGEDHTSGTSVKFLLNEFSFQTLAPKKFQDELDLRIWAEEWFRRHQENFLLSEGKVVGLRGLLARQVHIIENIPGGLSGEYYFNKVRHNISSTGYECEFNARKVIRREN